MQLDLANGTTQDEGCYSLRRARSAEHDVSRASAANVLRSLDPERYEVTLVGITRDGRWVVADSGNGAGTGVEAVAIPDDGPQLALLPGGQGRALILESDAAAIREGPAFVCLLPSLAWPERRRWDGSGDT